MNGNYFDNHPAILRKYVYSLTAMAA